MGTPHHLKIKLGDAEFEASGDATVVAKQYEEFKAMVAHRANLPPPSAAAVRPTAAAGAVVTAHGRSRLTQTVLDAVFRKSEPLSLTDRPKSDNADADALLILIYGHTEMRGQSDVTAATLANSARQTGINAERVGRTLGVHNALIKVSGARKGTRYALNNPGIAEAERIISSMAK